MRSIGRTDGRNGGPRRGVEGGWKGRKGGGKKRIDRRGDDSGVEILEEAEEKPGG